MKCNMDCFNCIYPDCILDEKDIQVEKRNSCTYYEMNRDKCLAKAKEYGRTHRDQKREYDKKRYAENREQMKARRREYYLKSKRESSDKRRQTATDYYYSHLKERKEYNKNYYREHKEYYRQKARERYMRQKGVIA